MSDLGEIIKIVIRTLEEVANAEEWEDVYIKAKGFDEIAKKVSTE